MYKRSCYTNNKEPVLGIGWPPNFKKVGIAQLVEYLPNVPKVQGQQLLINPSTKQKLFITVTIYM
jgi:hypothetical protein